MASTLIESELASMASTSMHGKAASDVSALCMQSSLCMHNERPSLRRSLHNKPNGMPSRRIPTICASSAAPYGPGGGGSEMVDANMNVLRKRIHRLSLLEAADGRVPEGWMDWEKSCYSSYKADVAYAMAGLQSLLLGVRPSASLFVLSVMLSAMPVASLLILRLTLQQVTPHL